MALTMQLQLEHTKEQFYPSNALTIDVDFVTLIVIIDRTNVNFEIWDTTGQKYFKSSTKVYY